MPPTLRTLLQDILWLLAAVAVPWLIITLYIGNSALDIHLNDTYFVIDLSITYVPFSLLIVFIVFSIKEWRTRFHRPFGWWIVLLSGSSFVLSLTYLATFATSIAFPEGWAAYPPLSTLGNTHMPGPKTTTDKPFLGLLLFFQAVALLLLLLAAYRRGTKRAHSTVER